MWLLLKIACLLVLQIFVFGCGSNPPIQHNQDQGIKISNYSFSGFPNNQIMKEIPKKVIVYGNSGLDTLVALGVERNVYAAVLTDNREIEMYKSRYPNIKIYPAALPLETVVSFQPDFILGWRRFFSDTQLGDTNKWIAQGIPAYIQDASGPVPAKGNFPPCNVDSEITFIRNMGKIFAKENKAEEYISEIKQELAIKSSQKNRKENILVVEFLGGNIEVFGEDLLSGDIVKKLGGNLLQYSVPFISQEELMGLDADRIFLVYHGQEKEKQAALSSMANPLYAHIKAIKNGKVYPIKYSMIVAPGVNTAKTIKYMSRCMLD